MSENAALTCALLGELILPDDKLLLHPVIFLMRQQLERARWQVLPKPLAFRLLARHNLSLIVQYQAWKQSLHVDSVLPQETVDKLNHRRSVAFPLLNVGKSHHNADDASAFLDNIDVLET